MGCETNVRTRIIGLLTMILPCAAMLAQNGTAVPPKREVRAVWITTAAGLDWPRSTDRAEQQASLHRIVADLKAARFNTIFFQARARGDAYYRSTYEPWAENLTGVLGKDPGWDPLAFLISDAHAAGLEVHAWFNVYKIRSSGPVPVTVPLHPSRAHALWTVQYSGETWFDPGLPEVRSYLLNVAMDLVKNYDIDGLNLDYVRYPGRDFPDDGTYRRYGSGKEKDEWRRSNVTSLVSDLYDRATTLKPMLKVGSSPLGVFDGTSQNSSSGSYGTYYQDSRGWLRAGKQDYLAPQLYWPIGATGEPDYAQLVQGWSTHASGRQLYAGIAAYKQEVVRQLGAQIELARACGLSGQSFYRYESIRGGIPGTLYRTVALPPPMPWKDSLPPLPPSTLAVTELAPQIFHLEWTAPSAAADSDRAQRYVIYRWPSPSIPRDDPRTIVAVIDGNNPYWIDTVTTPAGLVTYYAVSALDKGNNEGAPSAVVAATPREAIALGGKLTNFTTLVTSIGNGDGIPAFAGYHLATRTPVALELYRTGTDATDSLIATIVSAVQDQGAYVYGLRSVLRQPGRYVLRLKAGGTLLEQNVEVASGGTH
jgi:uncharacterized lipoprotein YddW (UPF0748 family)